METYLKCLSLLKDLLVSNDELFWAEWMQKDIDAWQNGNNTEHHLNAFGGAGSFNDINLSRGDAVGYWKNALMSNLSSISYVFAKDGKIELPRNSFFKLEGFFCRNCKSAELSENTVERFLAAKFVPELIRNQLENEQYLKILEIEKLIYDSKVEIVRSELKSAILEQKIALKPFGNPWSFTCATCHSSDKIGYSWDIHVKSSSMILSVSIDNLV